MRARIHRGAQEIGGNCIELEAAGKTLVLDLGRPLSAAKGAVVPLPPLAGLADGARESLLGVVISHPHQDHYGLLSAVSPKVPVFIGAAAERIVNAATWFNGSTDRIRATGHLEHRRPFTLGPFRITPFLNDHSAFDAYSLLIAAEGRRLFYTGDLRGSGRKGKLFDALCTWPPKGLHALLMEGTHVRPSGHAVEGLTERGVEEALVDVCARTQGAVFVAYSGQNIDRLVSVHRAAVKTGRQCVVDLYGATMAQATGRRTISQPGHRGLRVLVPKKDALKVLKERSFERVNALGRSRVYPEELARRPERFVITLRGNVLTELKKVRSFGDAVAIWSQWDGYLAQETSARVRAFVEERGMTFSSIHASGHATVAELRRLVTALAPERVVPIHSSATGRFAEFFPRVTRYADGEWWSV